MKTLNRMVGGTHYKNKFKIEPYEFISANKFDFATGNVIKYVCRHPFKNKLEDLKKAAHNLEILMEQEYGYVEELGNKLQTSNNENIIYISGPMTGIPGNNFYEFYKAQYELERAGWLVYNPANLTFVLADKLNTNIENINYEEMLKFDLQYVEKSKAIYFLNNSSTSNGALAEFKKAKELGLTMYYQKDGIPKVGAIA